MTTGARNFAVQTVLNEIKNVSPAVSNNLLFNMNGEIVATDNDTSSLTALHTAKTLRTLAEKADIIGGLESVTVYGSHRRMNIVLTNDHYLATVASKESSPMSAESLTRILIPTVLRLIDNFQLTPEPTLQTKEPTISAEQAEESEEPPWSHTEQSESTASSRENGQHELELDYEPSLTEPSATQFIIEHLGGLLAPPDTVRIDNTTIMEWNELYKDREISEVDLETLKGVTTRCKFKPIKDSKLEGKGVIQIPQKIQLTLQTSLGELVMVKPVIE